MSRRRWRKSQFQTSLVSFFPHKWRELATETAAMVRLCEHRSTESLLRTVLVHFGWGSLLRETVLRACQPGLADLALPKRQRKSRDWLDAPCVKLFRQHGIAVVVAYGDCSHMLGVYVLLVLCAGVVVFVLVISKRAIPQETQQNRIESLLVGFMNYVEDPACEAWKFMDVDWQREAEEWLANNKYGGLPEFRSVVARNLAAAAKDRYLETMQGECDAAFEEFQQDRRSGFLAEL